MAITLLPKDFERSKENPELRKFLNIGRTVLALYFVFLVIIGSIFGYVYFEQQKLAKNRDELTAQIKTNKDKEEKIILLKDRLTILAGVGGGPNFRQALDLLPGLFGNNLVVNDISLTGGELKINVSADDTFELDELVKNINKSSNLTKASLDNLDLSPTGDFVASLSLKMK